VFTNASESSPDCVEGKTWKTEGDLASDEIQEVMEWLESQGARPAYKRLGDFQCYKLELVRIYSDDELRDYRWFTLEPSAVYTGGIWEGTWHIDKSSMDEVVPLARVAGEQGIVVSTPFRSEILASCPIGVTMTPIAVVADQSGASEEADAPVAYSLGSEMQFPPLLTPPCEFVNASARPVDTCDHTKGFFLAEGHYREPELHYRKEDVTRVGNADVAMTNEVFGFRHQISQGLVVSHRFRQLVHSKGIQAHWFPVHEH